VPDKYTNKGSLSVSTDLEAFLKSEVLPGLDLSEDHFWTSLENIIHEFSPRNKELLGIRESMQGQIDAWHLANPGGEKNLDIYKDFLKDIG
jgi:Malate synthase